MRAAWTAPVAFVLAATACTAIIGTRDLSYDANADGGASSGGASGGTPPPVTPPPGSGDGGGDGATCVADFMTDAKNCGACAHDCLGGKCNMGVCEPVAIVTTNYPRYVQVDTSNIYFTDASLETVQVMSKATGMVKTLCKTPGTGTDELVIDATNAYFTFTTQEDGGAVGGIATCPLAGGGGTGTVKIPNQSYPYALVRDGTTFYWAVGDSPAQIMRYNGTTTAPIATGDTVTLGVFANYLYVANDTSNGTVKRCMVGATCTLQTVATDVDGFDAVLLVGNNLLWGTGVYPGTIWQGMPDGTGATKVTAVPPIPHSFAADDKFFYWVNAGPHDDATDSYDMGSVQYCPQMGGVVDCGATGPKTLSTTPLAFVHGLVVDDNAIYYVDLSTNGGLWRVAKPL